MPRPLIVDAFPFHNELDMLECRLTELGDVVDWFVPVEADVTHQDEPKPSYLRDNWDRFSAWHDKLVPVWAVGLPSAKDDPDPWARELSQREHIATGLAEIGVADTDVVMQSDVDEIPRALYVRNVRPGGRFIPFPMRFHCWAVDWLHPSTWWGTVATTPAMLKKVGGAPFGHMRTLRNQLPPLPGWQDCGWHFTWLGTADDAARKVNSFCHPEVEQRIRGSIANDNYYWREGYHVDGYKCAPVDVDDSWPRWIVEGRCPEYWFRPRD